MRKSNDISKINKFMPRNKVGIRVLNDMELENVFPSYDSLLQRIEAHRTNVSNIPKNSYQMRDYQLDMMYDNVYSLMGKRGSGKTSTLMTLKIKLCLQNDYDMVLPLVIPDVIPEDESIMSWLIAILEDEVISLEEQFENLRKNKVIPEKLFENCKVKDKLRDSFEKIKKMSLSKNFKPESSSSYYEMVGGAELKMRNSYTFSKELSKFWDELIAKIKELQELKENKKIDGKKKDIIEPLIFVMFDDVDLDPERASELISVIIKYLSHPNIIVLTTADENLFMKVVENKFKMTLYGSNMRAGKIAIENTLNQYFGGDEEDNNIDDELASKTMAKMYLDKVLPPSSRYFLKSFNKWADKCEICVEYKKESGILQDMLANVVFDFYKHVDGVEVDTKESSFLFYNKKFLKFYISFFGNTSRQIQNQWVIICEFIKDIKKLISNKKIAYDTYVRKMYYKVREFLHNSINTNSEFKKDIEDIDEYVDHIFYWEHNSYPFYIDYNYISEVLWSESRVLDAKAYEFEQKQQRAMSLLALCAFVENILLIVDSNPNKYISTKRGKLHLGKSVEKHIEWIMGGSKLIRREKNPDSMLYYYEDFLENVRELVNFNLYSGKSVRSILMKLDMKSGKEEILFKDIDNEWDDNQEYYEIYAKMLMMYYNNIYCIDNILLNRVEYVGKVFSIINRSSIAIQRRNAEMIVQYVLKNIQNNNKPLFEKFLDEKKSLKINIVETGEYYTLGQALNYTLEENTVEWIRMGYKSYIDELENQIRELSGYLVYDRQQVFDVLDKLEAICEQTNTFFSHKLFKTISGIREEISIPEIPWCSEVNYVSKAVMERFINEVKHFNEKTNGRYNQIILNCIWSLGVSIDLCVKESEKELIMGCAKTIKILMMLHEDKFNELFQSERERSMYSVNIYKKEVFKERSVMSEKWYEKIIDIVCKDDTLLTSVFYAIEDYLVGYISE